MKSPHKQQYHCKILSHTKIAEPFMKLTIDATPFADQVQPGHFLTVGIPNAAIPFLKKPFTIYDKTDQTVTMVYRIIGSGTTAISQLRPKETLLVLAPLGIPCPIPPIPSAHKIALVGGGVGIASLHLLGKQIGKSADLFYGVRTAAEQLEIMEWKSLVKNVYISSDDGSVGKKEFITTLVEEHLKKYTLVYTCGPKIMMQKISHLCKNLNIPHYVIMEEYMACGIGVCMGCVVQTHAGTKRACKDGPTLNGADIIW